MFGVKYRSRAKTSTSPAESSTQLQSRLGDGPSRACGIMPAMEDSMEQGEPSRDLDPVIEAYKKHIDITLIRENLRLTVDQRFQQLMKLQQFAEDLRRAGRKARSQK